MIVYNSLFGCYFEHGPSSQFYQITLLWGLVLFWFWLSGLKHYVVLLVDSNDLEEHTAYKATWYDNPEGSLPWKCVSISFYRSHSKV
jgi:hypothetical protein